MDGALEAAGPEGGALRAGGCATSGTGAFDASVAVADAVVEFPVVETAGCGDCGFPRPFAADAALTVLGLFAPLPRRPRLSPRPPACPPKPRSRCSILAAALALPRSRFLSASAALAVLFGVTAGLVGAGTAFDGLEDIFTCFAFAACLFNTFTASRATCSTLTACALRFLGGDMVTLPEALLESGVTADLLSFES